MVVRRCGFYAIGRARPYRSFPPQPRVGPQSRRQQVAWCHGFIFPRVPSHVASTAVTHVVCMPPTTPGHGHQKRPITTTGVESQQHGPDCICVRYAAVHAIVFKDKQQHSILKGWKTNPDFLFKVRIFELRLTSLALAISKRSIWAKTLWFSVQQNPPAVWPVMPANTARPV